MSKGPSEDVPGDAPLDEIREKFESIMSESKAEGRLGMTVTGENGDEKERVEYIRVNGEGSIEARKFNQGSSTEIATQPASNSKVGIRRRDKLDN